MNTDRTLFADGFDDAIIGLWNDTSTGINRVVYDGTKMVDILTDDDGVPEDQAMEHLQFNTFNAYYGKGTPIYVTVMNREEIDHYIENNDE